MFRFSIREMMLVTAVVAIAVGWIVDRRLTAMQFKDFESRLAPIEKEYQQKESIRQIELAWKESRQEVMSQPAQKKGSPKEELPIPTN